MGERGWRYVKVCGAGVSTLDPVARGSNDLLVVGRSGMLVRLSFVDRMGPVDRGRNDGNEVEASKSSSSGDKNNVRDVRGELRM